MVSFTCRRHPGLGLSLGGSAPLKTTRILGQTPLGEVAPAPGHRRNHGLLHLGRPFWSRNGRARGLDQSVYAQALATHLAARCVASPGPVGLLATSSKRSDFGAFFHVFHTFSAVFEPFEELACLFCISDILFNSSYAHRCPGATNYKSTFEAIESESKTEGLKGAPRLGNEPKNARKLSKT